MPRAPLTVIAVALCACVYAPVAALAAPTARMSAAFKPERLGSPTTVSFAFQVSDRNLVPAALTGVELAYPRNLGLATSDLGIAACNPALLEAGGAEACPANSRMGSGSALTELAFGADPVKETARLALFAGPSPDGYLHLLIYGSGSFPVEAAVVMSAVLLPGHLAITVPPIPSLPEAPYLSVAEMHITLGGHLTYYEMVKGRRVAYRPAGVGLPSSCPHGGFRFAAAFSFVNGQHSSSRTAVACPTPRR